MGSRRGVLGVLAGFLVVSGLAACTPGPLPTPPPVVLLPDYFEVDAHDWAGTSVTWPDPVVVASDHAGTYVECDADSGDVFEIGLHFVDCRWYSAGPAQGFVGTFSFVVRAADDLPPVLDLPGDLNVGVDSITGGVVEWTATAISGNYVPTPVTCVPASGSVLPLGVTTVSCSATSAFGDTTTGEFDIETVPPIAAITDGTSECRIGVDGVARCQNHALRTYPDDWWTDVGFSGPVAALSGSNPWLTSGSFYERHLCAVLVDGTVECVGSNTAGQLGDGTNTDAGAPVAVSGVTNAVDVHAVSEVTCVLLADGGVRCWGANGNGQLGDGTNTASNVPVAVTGITTATSLDVAIKPYPESDVHVCAGLADGTTRCWGANGNSQLANGGPGDSSVPTLVLSISDTVDVSAGGLNGCALDTVGVIRCWGDNYRGQLGTGDFDPFAVPEPVVAIGPAADVSTSQVSSCALLADASIWCWGLLGVFTPTPVQVSGLGPAEAVWALNEGGCARLVDQTVWCWNRDTPAWLVPN